MKRRSERHRKRNLRVARGRLARRLRRALRIRIRRRSRKPTPRLTSPSVAFYAQALGLEPLERRKLRKLPCPPILSFIDAPEEATETIQRLVSYLIGGSTRKVRIVQDTCRLIDYDAECILTAIAIEANKLCRVEFCGRFPTDPDAKEIAAATGMARLLGATDTNDPKFLLFRIRSGRASLTGASSAKETTTTDLVEHIDNCLRRYGFELEHLTQSRLAETIGEVLTNAEEHSGHGAWWVAAYMRQTSQEIGDVHIVVFNLGYTFYESLSYLPRGSLLRQQIESLVLIHSKRGLFRPSHWTEENLWTLYALQGAVSRLNVDAHTIGDRGQGTADMIQFFQSLGQTRHNGLSPVMCIVSGHTQIVFDGRYGMIETTRNGERIRKIAMNDENDFSKPPDPRNVRHLRTFFPGTVISMRLYFDKNHLQGLSNET